MLTDTINQKVVHTQPTLQVVEKYFFIMSKTNNSTFLQSVVENDSISKNVIVNVLFICLGL